jgi:hypothetical protein
MKLPHILASLSLLVLISGCATFSDSELAQIRQHGVAPAIVGKMEDGRVLTPSEVIELTRRGVPDDFIIRQIDDAGVDYVLNRNDVKKLRSAHVSQPVIDALQAQSDEFASHYSSPGHVHAYAAYPPYPYDYYYGGYPYYYPYGDVVVDVHGGCWGHRHCR